ncbi:MAG TPA: PEP-CTERM sorting domain-containing protein [Verrucomicrobiae bacterium]|nr:PEP-CTERM sorting domain-containing protein [Verrucomicrobiae bacterium]
MKKKTLSIKPAAIFVALGFSGVTVFAAATASDTAANYAGSWSASPANLGSGFGPWANQVVNNDNPPYAGTYLDQTSYGNADGVLSAGYAWGTYANSPTTVTPEMILSRPFTSGPSGSASLYNQTFTVGIGSTGIGGAGSSVSVNIGTAFNLGYAGGGSDNFTFGVDGGATSPIPVTFADLNAGLEIALSVSGPLNSLSEVYTLTLSPFAGGAPYYTTSGTFDSADYKTSNFTFVDDNTSNDEFVNNLNISSEAVPEPSALALLGVSSLGTFLAFRRRG